RLLRGADIDSVVDCARQDPLRPPPIALVEADLVVELDLVAMLSSTIAAALPCAGSDRELAQRVREARAVRAELPASPDACRQAIDSIWRRHLELDPELTLRLRHTVANGLAVRRAFVRDRSDGSSLVRASLCLPDEGPALPCWMEDVMLEGVTLPPRLRCVAVVALAVLPHTVHGPSVGARVLALASFVARGAGKDGGRA
ncbi:MAG: hypothetical protein JNK04_12530, partial [Myxococcales bacterium]|nr:hypothetical protein [Myxococcales bacterium]